MHNFNPADGADELWHVKLATGEVCLMTLDQLTQAYRRGEVDCESYVCREGSTDWARLGAVVTFERNSTGRTRVRVSTYPPPPSDRTSHGRSSSYPVPPSNRASTSYPSSPSYPPSSFSAPANRTSASYAPPANRNSGPPSALRTSSSQLASPLNRISTYPPPGNRQQVGAALRKSSSNRKMPSVLGHNSWAPFSADVDSSSALDSDLFRVGQRRKWLVAAALLGVVTIALGVARFARIDDPALSATASPSLLDSTRSAMMLATDRGQAAQVERVSAKSDGGPAHASTNP